MPEVKKRPSARVVRPPVGPKMQERRRFVLQPLPDGWVCVFRVMYALGKDHNTTGMKWSQPQGRFKTKAIATAYARKDPKHRRFEVVFGFEEWNMEAVRWTTK